MSSESLVTSHIAPSSESAYNDLRRLIPSLAQELDQLRTSLREHNLWLQRYGHSGERMVNTGLAGATTATTNTELPAYSASDVPPYSGGPSSGPSSSSTREDVMQRRDQITEWLREGEDVLRDYSSRFAQLGEELQKPFEDVLGTWVESNPDNALPDYERVEEREELLVGVGEVPPPYVRGSGKRTEAEE
ncbi:hypothetical protein PVAG01_10462 [Phlyctema vagabunda]|uniref:Uncharacterized protein n=1 Tax=Phlyctema vagabunda TaxID=108571 RepID=A0ABR4P6M6_9HELO